MNQLNQLKDKIAEALAEYSEGDELLNTPSGMTIAEFFDWMNDLILHVEEARTKSEVLKDIEVLGWRINPSNRDNVLKISKGLRTCTSYKGTLTDCKHMPHAVIKLLLEYWEVQ